MLPWDVPENEIRSAIQYFKTFSPAWKERTAGTPVAIPPDPWGNRRAEALARGRAVYHFVARCWSCHPAYLEEPDLRRGLNGLEPRDGWRESAAPADGERGFRARPPDFLHDNVRAGTAPSDLVRTIACGVGGTAMPTYVDALTPEDLWAVTRYVGWLVDSKGSRGR